MTDRLSGTHVLITGAAGGIGAATARRLATEGAELLLADLDAGTVETFARRMRSQTPMPGSELRGKLIQTASIAAFRGGQNYMVHYNASKAGVVSLTRTAANALAVDRITSNCICPGAVDTPMWTRIDADWAEIEGLPLGEAWRRRTSLIPLGRPEKAEDVAGIVAFLASRDSDYMTGQALIVDGGLVVG